MLEVATTLWPQSAVESISESFGAVVIVHESMRERATDGPEAERLQQKPRRGFPLFVE